MSPALPVPPAPVSPVAVTGMGVVSAAGITLAENLASLERGRVNAAAPPFPTAHSFPVFRCPVQGLCPLEDAAAFPGVFRAPGPSAYTRTVGLALTAAREALHGAGIAPEELPGLRAGVVVGTSVGASLNFLDFYKAHAAGQNPPLDEIGQYLASNPALALARLLGCRGPAQTVTNACSSGADAIGLAAFWIRSGLCDVVMAGGADELSPISYAGFSSLRLPSPEPCRPFDAARSGLSLGEGAGFIVLEGETSRNRRAAPARAFIAGYGTATDAYHLTAPHPEGRGLAASAAQAFAQAGAGWGDVAFINAHGTGTTANDAAEDAFFRTRCPKTPFIATKGSTGHTLGAAGAIEAIFAASHLHTGALPPSPGFCSPDPAMGVAPVKEATPVSGRLALSQSLAFGGNNSVLLLAKGEA